MGTAVIITWIGMLIASILHNPVKTTIVLVDNNKSHNAIVVETKVGTTIIDKPGYYVNLTSKNSKPSSIKKMSKNEINKIFHNAIKALPLKPVHIYLYFKKGTDSLTAKSIRELLDVYKLIKQRAPCDINIIGHTDTVGTQKDNLKLSLKRAENIKKLILSKKPKINNLKVESYGENDLIVQTADNVSEPKNRSVEIFIR